MERVPASVARPQGRLLRGAEPALLCLLWGVLALFAALAAWTGQAVDWTGIAIALGPAAALIAVGCYVRAAKGMERLPVLLVALGFYVAFGNLVGCLIYLRFPFGGPALDPVLTRIDRALGYDWAAGVAWLHAHPRGGSVLAFVYKSSLWQLLAVLGYLVLSGREADLHRFLLVGTVSLLLTTAIWWVAPSLGPATLVTIPGEVAAAARLVVDAANAAELLRLAAEGTAVLSPRTITGTIAFPSYHLVMATLVTWFAWRTPLFWPALILNVAMVPATMLQGGHHAVDLLGGAAVFLVTRWAVDGLRSARGLRVRRRLGSLTPLRRAAPWM